MENKEQYIAPVLTVVEFKNEHGYTNSTSSVSTGFSSTNHVDMFLLQTNSEYNNQAQQNWTDGGNLFDWGVN